jgi:hypothetical protein
MAKKRKKASRLDLATENILLAEEDVAAMRPALAVAPELVVQTLTEKRRRPRKQAKKKVKARKSSAKKARKSAAKRKKPKTARKK